MTQPGNQPSIPSDAIGGPSDPLVIDILADLQTNDDALQDKDFRDFLTGLTLPPGKQPAWAVHAHNFRRLQQEKRDAAAVGGASAATTAERSTAKTKLEPNRNREIGVQHGDAKRRVLREKKEVEKEMQREKRKEEGKGKLAVRAVMMDGSSENTPGGRMAFPLGYWICHLIDCLTENEKNIKQCKKCDHKECDQCEKRY